MKQLIVMAAILPFLLIFLLQYSLDQKNNDNISRLQDYVYTAKEQAKQEGCFTASIKRELREKIIIAFNLNEEDIEILADETPKYRTSDFDDRELIYYKVSVPIEKIMAGNNLFGISDQDNRSMYTIESWTASELLRD